MAQQAAFTGGGKVAVVVGGANGIGKGCTALLSSLGVATTIVGRTKEKTEAAVQETGAKGYLLVDITKQADVRRLAADLASRFDHIDYLVLTAGRLFSGRQVTEDGVEGLLAHNYLWRFQLVCAIRELLFKAPDGARVLNVAGAGINADVFFDDPALERTPYTTIKAAWQAQQLNDVFTVQAQRRWGGQGNGVQFHVVFPGQVRTKDWIEVDGFVGFMLNYASWPIKKSIETSAKQLVPLLLEPVGAVGGKLWSAGLGSGPVYEVKPAARVVDSVYGEKCWELSESLVKV